MATGKYTLKQAEEIALQEARKAKAKANKRKKK